MADSTRQSLQTILNFQNRDMWSVVWSTTHIPSMDNAAGGMGRHPVHGRRRLHIGALTLGAFLTMHCRIAAAALTGGFFIFMFFLILAVALLANPLRHFEVYLGQWSISGPGRAFRIIPMLDGIGIAICINTIVRAIICCTVAAIAAMYVVHSVKDDKLPFTYCRDFDLKPYDPVLKDLKSFSVSISKSQVKNESTKINVIDGAWRNSTDHRVKIAKRRNLEQIPTCKEVYNGSYPTFYITPSYNFFYVEILSLRSDYSFSKYNVYLVLAIVMIWFTLWVLMAVERCNYGRMVWNNIHVWLIAVPWIWVTILLTTAIANLVTINKSFGKYFRTTKMEAIVILTDAVECALYIHSASTGTEIIHGKGLNHYASGHIDPHLNYENVLHSGVMLLLTALHAGAASLCAFVDCAHPGPQNVYSKYESTLWIIPLYSKCALVGNHTHLLSALLFGGLTFSYMTAAYILLKTALHTIYEYRVKLVFREQAVVAALLWMCAAISLLFVTNGGVVLLESVDSLMTGLSTPYVCLLELVGLLYVYRGQDFVSDIHIATEDNTCSTRISTQWQIIPIITIVSLVLKITVFKYCELPNRFMLMALTPLAFVVLSVPLRAATNTYSFVRRMWFSKKGNV